MPDGIYFTFQRLRLFKRSLDTKLKSTYQSPLELKLSEFIHLKNRRLNSRTWMTGNLQTLNEFHSLHHITLSPHAVPGLKTSCENPCSGPSHLATAWTAD